MQRTEPTIALVSRAWFPNHQRLFDLIGPMLNERGIKFRYGVMIGSERGRTWKSPDFNVTVIPEKIGPGKSVIVQDKEIALPFGILGWLAKTKPDCIISTPCSEIGNFLAIREARRKGIPSIGWMVGTREFTDGVIDEARLYISRLIHRQFCKNIDYAFTYGTKAQKDITKLRLKRPPISYVVRHTIDEGDYWISTDEDRVQLATSFRAKFKLQNCFTFGYVGQLIKRKGADLLLHAFNSLTEETGFSANLLVLGNGPLRTIYEQASTKKPERIRLISNVAQEEMRSLFAAVDCMVVPSRFDDWSTIINESVCSQTPIIASDGAHAAFDLLNRKNIFSAGSVTSLKEALRSAWLKRNLVTTDIQDLQNRYKATWTLETVANLWVDHLTNIIKQCPRVHSQI
ncbi:MAG: glycosyltransferase [Gammaproteobacteria bacterium]|nr:glycosyltransferase [Gammaproteobacteria bacterium]